MIGRKEKIKVLKRQWLEHLDIEREEGNVVYVKGGSIDFDMLGDCYVRTVKIALSEVLGKTFQKETITQEELSKVILKLIAGVEGK